MDIQQPTLSSSFAQLGLHEALTHTLQDLGYETPTPIQQQTIPVLLAGTALVPVGRSRVAIGAVNAG